MKKLVLLKGAPGSGKSTFIKYAGLQDYTISSDQLRRLCSATFSTLEGVPSLSIPRETEKLVWDFIYGAIQSRMEQGMFTILDSTMPNNKPQQPLVNLARKYGYEVIVYNVQGGTSLDELLSRNQLRIPAERVAPKVIEKIYRKVVSGRNAEGVREIHTLEQLHREMYTPQPDFTEYDNIVVIGDVQSCSRALHKALDFYGGLDGTEKRTAFVFVGDLFDRGDDAAGVFSMLHEKGTESDNMYFVEGNHEKAMRHVIHGTSDRPREATRRSLAQIEEAGFSREDVDAFLNKFQPFLSFQDRNGQKYLVTHGGVCTQTFTRLGGYLALYRDRSETLSAYDIADDECIFGTRSMSTTRHRSGGDYDVLDSELKIPGVIQFHGHRNQAQQDVNTVPGVYNLEQGVEFDGHLATACISTTGVSTIEVHLFKND